MYCCLGFIRCLVTPKEESQSRKKEKEEKEEEEGEEELQLPTLHTQTSKGTIEDAVKWETIKWEDTTKFTVPIHVGQVIKVYDGDTITVAARLPMMSSPIYRFSVRLNGIDTPEIKGKDEDEREAAKNAKKALSALILNKQVTLRNVDTEKYGRILADVYIDDVHVNKWLIAERFALPYDGGTKTLPKSWLAYKLTGVVV
jgi:endonuclease YncB( thermonuclease family)